MKLVSAAPVMTVEKNNFGPDLVFFPSLELFSAGEPDEMLLKAASSFGPDALLLGADRYPTVFAHAFENRGSG
jgi:hypothetical protein